MNNPPVDSIVPYRENYIDENNNIPVNHKYEEFLSNLRKFSSKQISNQFQQNPIFQVANSLNGKTPWHILPECHEGFPVLSRYILPRINEKNVKGYAPLHQAAINGDVEKCQALITLGADTTIRDDQGNSFLHLAAKEFHLNILEHFYSTDDNQLVNDQQLTILDVCLLANPILRMASNLAGFGTDMQNLIGRHFNLYSPIQIADNFSSDNKATLNLYTSADIYHFFQFNKASLDLLDENISGYVSWFDDNGQENIYYRSPETKTWEEIDIIPGNKLKAFYTIFDAYQQKTEDIFKPYEQIDLNHRKPNLFYTDDAAKYDNVETTSLYLKKEELLLKFADRPWSFNSTFKRQLEINNTVYDFVHYIVDGQALDFLGSFIFIRTFKDLFSYIRTNWPADKKLKFFKTIPEATLQSSLDENGNNLLHISVCNPKDDQLTLYLLEIGLNPEKENKFGLTPLYYLVKYNSTFNQHLNVLKWLLSKDNPQSHLMTLFSLEDSNQVPLIENAELNTLVLANQAGSLMTIDQQQHLVPYNADGIRKLFQHAFTSNEFRSEISNKRQARQAIFDTLTMLIDLVDDSDMQEQLLEGIADFSDINFIDETGNTLLHYAAKSKNFLALNAILARKPNILITNKNHQVAWNLFSVSNREEALDILEKLLKTGIQTHDKILIIELLGYAERNNIYPQDIDILNWVMNDLCNASQYRRDYIELLDYLFENTKAILRWVKIEMAFNQVIKPSRDFLMNRGEDFLNDVKKNAFLLTLINPHLNNEEKEQAIAYCFRQLQKNWGSGINDFLIIPEKDFYIKGSPAIRFIAELEQSSIKLIFRKYPPQMWFSDYDKNGFSHSAYQFLLELFEENQSLYDRFTKNLDGLNFFSKIIHQVNTEMHQKPKPPILTLPPTKIVPVTNNPKSLEKSTEESKALSSSGSPTFFKTESPEKNNNIPYSNNIISAEEEEREFRSSPTQSDDEKESKKRKCPSSPFFEQERERKIAKKDNDDKKTNKETVSNNPGLSSVADVMKQ